MLSNKVNEIMTRDLLAVDVASTVFEAMQLMASKNVGRVLVSENGVYTGIFTEKDVLKRVLAARLDAKATSIKKVMTKPIRSVPEDTHIVEALGKMYRSKFRHLLVAERKGKIVGMVSMRRILELAVELGDRLSDTQKIGNILLKDPIKIESSKSIRNAIDAMIKNDTGCVVVMSGQDLKGIFTERDLLKRVAVVERDPDATQLHSVMTTNLVTLPTTVPVSQVLTEMRNRRFRHMVIVDQGKLAGMVSMRDVLKYAKALDVDESVRSTWKEIEEFWESDEHYTPG
ncbi:MAG TPA: CBS domain-containing protein [Verrucomicrobiae bacterium]|jgi:CBS domain-containing protein|nr:CBS domain-containing protein [Verrucomicrobiae bacterium]